MAAAVSGQGRIELASPNFDGSLQAYSGLHAVSPVLFGLSAPCIAIAMLAPRSLIGLQLAALALLVVVALAATIIFVVSVFAGGRVAGIAFDNQARVVEIISIGTFARRVESIPFADVSGLRVNSRYDRDGYHYVTTELVLKTGEVVSLPVVPSDGELKAVRTALAGR